MKKQALILLAGLLAGTVCAETNWKAWARPAGSTAEGDKVTFTAPAGKRTEFMTRVNLEKEHFYRISFELDFPGAAPESYKYGLNKIEELPYSFVEMKNARGKTAPVIYTYAGEDMETYFRVYFVANAEVKGVLANPKIEKLSAGALKKAVMPENGTIVSNWIQPSWMKKALKVELVDAADHIDEGKAVKITAPESFYAKRPASVLSNSLPLVPDTDYRVTAWVKGNGVGTGTIGVNSWYNNKVKHYYCSGNIAVTKEWTQVEFRFRTPSLKEHPQLEKRVTNGSIGFRPTAALNEFQFKDFTLERIEK